jgi:hypothetical protein
VYTCQISILFFGVSPSRRPVETSRAAAKLINYHGGLDLVKSSALDSYYFRAGAGAGAAAFFCTTHRGKLRQHKLIRVHCTKKSTRVPVSPVPQYGYSV